MDKETGLYYYGARYLDPKYSMWISTDPALGEYIPKAPTNEEARRHNQNLPGMGGVFNHINGGLYHYAGNNPVRYIDTTGRYCEFSFNYRNYFEGQAKGFCYGVKASFQDLFGKMGNFVKTIFTKSTIAFYGEAELLIGAVACTGTVTVNSNGTFAFDVSKPTDVLLSEIEKIAELPVCITTSGINTDIPITGSLYVVTGITVAGDDNYQLKLGAKLDTNTLIGGVSAGAGIIIHFRPSVHNGPFGTIRNRKSCGLNENAQNFGYHKSLNFFMGNIK